MLLNGFHTGLTGADTDDVCQRQDEYLSITDLAGMGCLLYGFNDHIELRIIDSYFELDLGQKVDDILRAAVKLCVSFLSPEPFDFGDSHSGNADFGKVCSNIIEFERFYNGSNKLHGYSPFVA